MKELIDNLYSEARRALKIAMAPFSHFRVGVALLTIEGQFFTGCNIENPSLTMSECAERIAILKAISEGIKDIKAIMIVSSKGNYCYPCGSCRQLIYEFAPDADIYIAGKRGIKKYTIQELLPHGFKQK